MESQFQSALVFALFVVPGFLLIRGYARGRTHAVPPLGLYALAEAIVASLLLLMIAWWPLHLGDIIRWADDGTLLATHEAALFWFTASMVLAPYPAGRVGGVIMEAIGSRPASKVNKLMTRCDLLGPPTVWDSAWTQMKDQGRAWAIIRTIGGDEIVGVFAADSRVGTSPLERQIYLEQEYGETADGFGIISDEGVYVDESSIESIHFKRIVEEEPGNPR